MPRLVLLTATTALLAISAASADQPSGAPSDPDKVLILASYPKPIRDAILKVAGQTSFLAKLEQHSPKDPLEPLLAGQSGSAAGSPAAGQIPRGTQSPPGGPGRHGGDWQ